MFNDALKSKKISHDQTPWFPMPKDSEAAGSYIYPEDFAKILAALPTKQSIDAKNAKVKRQAGRRNGTILRGRVREYHHLRPFFCFLYATGCRVGAAEKITWKMVRKKKDAEFVIDLPAEIMKTKNGLSLTVTGKLMQKRQRLCEQTVPRPGRIRFRFDELPDGVEQSMRQSWPARLR